MKRLGILVMFCAQLMCADSDMSIRMPDVVLDAIRHCECLKEADGTCNPNVIRINADEDTQRAKAAGFAVNGHIIRCNSSEECSVQAQALINGGITNLDLGPYQINYKYHPNPMLHEYFVDATEREHANRIITGLVKSFGYSWETLGRYHHFCATDRTRNETYYRKMYAYIYGNNSQTQSSAQ
ncbi:MAG TPA: hypothetical protein PLM93_02000 [Sulfuricurvum sp.]|nr:MAG: hypothetical protein B7Y30_07125 [Campylobacterales bacterium 16-40-21]OZA03545.1 MAG: hypothetical protein B7X89_02455 [Sulfuricurvum sp. 17-40-25]HQS65943.1 hypothetical protein [Sulfuricurvum sp.]HQT35818.1 hypothetical protein [Sulfuricurvum sp.]